MHSKERLDDHQKFRELAILAQRGTISDIEQGELNNHLRVCHACRQVSEEYSLISAAGMPFLAAHFDHNPEAEEWDDRDVRDRLMSRVRRIDERDSEHEYVGFQRGITAFSLQNAAARWILAGLAACALFAVAAGMHWVDRRDRMAEQKTWTAQPSGGGDISTKKEAKEKQLAVQGEQLSRLQIEIEKERREIFRLQEALQAAQSHAALISAADAKTAEQLREASAQKDKLANQLHDTEQSYQLLLAELTNVKADREKVLLRTTSLQTRIDELEASTLDQERRLQDDEQYLSSDRDIRELMGARKLYIADVFDVDSGSRTRKPFGRVFYTQNRSLIFYAFDLDRQPGVKNASSFQVWGQRDAEEQNHATNLGILYMDSESNRRWVLRIDDAQQLAELDAVFVTIEPHGGSQKPTGKPFLYALLRREANHP